MITRFVSQALLHLAAQKAGPDWFDLKIGLDQLLSQSAGPSKQAEFCAGVRLWQSSTQSQGQAAETDSKKRDQFVQSFL